MRSMIFALMFPSLFIAGAVYAQEGQTLECKAEIVKAQKEAAQIDFHRGELLKENANLRYRLLDLEEKALKAKLEVKK